MPTSSIEKEAGWVSVTEVIDYFQNPHLVAWKLKVGAKEAKRISTIALKTGSRIDELIQSDVKDGKYKLSSKDSIEVRNCMEAWECFKRDYSFKAEECQEEVRDEEAKVLGHLDLLGLDRLIDVKAASSIKDNYWVQTAKYSDIKFGGLVIPAILRLDKNLGTYQFIDILQAGVDQMECVRVFDGLLAAYRYYNPPTAVKEVVSE